jgi:hypothetical protein
MFMNTTTNELKDLVDRYAAEKGITIPLLHRSRLILWAEWLLQQNFCKPDVSGWLEFEKHKPNEQEKVVFMEEDGNTVFHTYDSRFSPSMMNNSCRWFRLPTIS